MEDFDREKYLEKLKDNTANTEIDTTDEEQRIKDLIEKIKTELEDRKRIYEQNKQDLQNELRKVNKKIDSSAPNEVELEKQLKIHRKDLRQQLAAFPST